MTRLPMLDPLEAIRRLYFSATEKTIERDFDEALRLLKLMPDEDERSRATVYMQGLAEMRSEWRGTRKQRGKR